MLRRNRFHFAQIQWALDNARVGSMHELWYVYATPKGFISTNVSPPATKAHYIVSVGNVRRYPGLGN